MKTRILSLSTLAVAALALFSCAKVEKEIEKVNISNGVPFELVASSSQTKTTNDNYDISWVANDNLNVFHAETATTEYGANDEFTITSANLAANKFTGTINALDPAKNYDWYALYPYNKDIKTPNNTSGAGYLAIGSENKNTPQVQTGNNNMAHLSGQYFPLYGKQLNVPAATAPSITLKPAVSILKVRVTNKNEAPLTVSSIAVFAPEAIVGTFFIKFDGESAEFTAKDASKTARLTVASGTPIAQNGYADFYIAVKPFTAKTGSTLTIVVNGYSKTTAELGSDFTFAEGKVTKVGFDYNAPSYDQLVYSSLNISGSSYANWSDIPGTYSNAVYSGQSFPNDENYIQLRSTSPSGIVSTTSGGSLKKVAVVWNSKTSDGRKVTIFGKNTPYSGPADLYNDATKGTSLGEIEKGSTELEIDDYYEYVGILASGALYLDQISIHWGAAMTKIAAPTNVAAAETTGGTITVTWIDVPSGVAKYIVTCTGQDSQDVLPGVQTAAFAGLMNGNYDVTIQAVPSDTEHYSNSDITTINNVAVVNGIAAPVYTLDGTVLCGNENNGYADAHAISQGGIGWSATCNANINPWRFGGKSIDGVDRPLYSTTAISNNISKIVLENGTANLTVNSLTVTVHSTADDAANGTNAIATFAYDNAEDIISKVITMNKADASSWAGKFYRIVYNVTNTNNSNKYIQFIKAEFYE